MAEWREGLSGEISRGSFGPHKHPSPPSYLGFWGADAHPWGKQFINYGCPVTWEPPSLANRYMLSCRKVQEWDNSAGLKAFQNAKLWLWAKINNHQCEIPLPDPDMYIDDVDYDAFIDPELVADLDYFEPEQAAAVDGFASNMNESIRATEWVDTQVPVHTIGLTARQLSAKSDVFAIGNTIKPSGWNVAENSYGWDVRGKSFSAWHPASWSSIGACGSRLRTSDAWGNACVKNSWQGNKQYNAWNTGSHKISGCHGNASNDTSGKYGRGCFDSRKTTSWFKTDYTMSNSGGKNFKGKQNMFDHNEKTVYTGRRTTLQWRPKSSVPGNKQAPNDAGATLQGEK